MSEFQKLWSLLKEIYPSQLIPPLPDNKTPTNNVLLKLALEVVFDHEILREDEYLKSFLCVEVFSDCVQLIKNVEPPVQVKKEYFGGKWSAFTTNQIDRKIKLKCSDLFALKDKFKQLVPSFDRLNYETREVNRSAAASEQTTRHFLYLNKSKRLYAEESERAGEFFKKISEDFEEDKSNEIVYYLNFCIKYIESIDVLSEKLNSFNNYLMGKREKVSELAKKLDRMQMPLQSKPSFDLIYQTKIKHEKLLEEIAVIEVTYEKFLELVEKELQRIFYWIKINFRIKMQ